MENITRFSLYSTLVGALVNIALNALLIPRYGNIGAAWATLLALFSGGYLVNACHGKTRRIFFLQTRSLLFAPACARLVGEYAGRKEKGEELPDEG